MQLPVLAFLGAYATVTNALITYTLERAANPTADQTDAYKRIDAAMKLAVARYTRLASRPNKHIIVRYVPSVQTADANFGGPIRFGSNRSYMNERTALHETSHTLGVGTTSAYQTRCKANNWPSATKLLRSWDGAGAKINCDSQHIWPYGLNYDSEWSETNGNRHCQLIDAMLADGLAG